MTNRKHNATGRSTGKQLGHMGKLNRPPKDRAWAWDTDEMLESEAWWALGVNALKILARLKLEHMAHAGTENGALMCTYDDFVARGIGRKYIAGALRELEYFGFIRVSHGEPNGNRRPPNHYRLTWLPTRDGTPATNQWKGITPEHVKAWKDRRRQQNKTASTKNRSPVPNGELKSGPNRELKSRSGILKTKDFRQ